jgi:hypothetical protein
MACARWPTAEPRRRPRTGELGLEPAVALQVLQRAILEQSPSLDAEVRVTAERVRAAPDEPGPAVFLCHSSYDKEYVRRLERRLRKSGMRTWLDERDLLPGSEWDPAIRDAPRGGRRRRVPIQRLGQ